jgi:hypothetical protein
MLIARRAIFYSFSTGCCDFPGPFFKRQHTSFSKRTPMLAMPGHRTLLNAELAAKYLLGAGEFEYAGMTYKDAANSPYRSWEQGLLVKGAEAVPSWTSAVFAKAVPKVSSHAEGTCTV